MLPTINFNNIGAFMQGQTLPKVHGTTEADKYPTPINSEVVILDADDDSIAYYKTTDVNGYSKVVRKRWFDDPEPTQEEINDQKYLTIEEFNTFKKEVLNGQQAILESINADKSAYTKQSGSKYRSKEPNNGLSQSN